ncbi:MAG TPA: lipid-A-disaccharide synthase [Alphaproteobacteria bacterium]|nr:lipid-A-disaccharide synthase [Alphaproteobacteria bacterium]
MTDRPLVFLIAGEPSGDRLGGRLMARLRRKTGENIAFAGIGGDQMVAEGLEPLFPMAELSVMGIAEILPGLPRLLRRIDQTVGEVARRHPDVLITIDAPDFCFRVAKKAHRLGIPCIHYAAPSVWVWRAGRARKIARFLDHLLALLPFEPPYFERVGLPCTFVGHPAIEGGVGKGDGGGFRARHALAPDRKVIAMLPGSRKGEIERLLPVFIETMRRVQAGRPPLTVAVPTVPHIAALVKGVLAGSGLETVFVDSEPEKFDAFAASEAALAKSGTVTLELALSSVPAIVAYRVNAISYAIAIRLANFKYAALPNLVLDRPLIPEFLQDECRAEPMAAALAKLLDDPTARAEQIAGAQTIRKLLSGPTGLPSEAAADVVLKMLEVADQRLLIAT